MPTATQGALAELNLMNASGNDFLGTVFLFKDTFAPTAATVYTDFVSLCDFDGYAPVSIHTSPYGTPADDGSGNAAALHSDIVFTKSAGSTPNTVYGYGIKDNSGALQYAKQFSGGPYDMSVTGSTITLQITVKLKVA